MKIRLIGLGKMGWNLAINLKRNGHEISVYDIDSDKVNEAKEAGMDAEDLLHALESGNPAIFLRHHYVNIGILSVDPRPLLKGQEEIIAKTIKLVLAQGVG